MANSRKKNAIYIDELGTIQVGALSPTLIAVLITPNAANARFKLKESVSGTIVVDVAIETAESRYIDFADFYGISLTSNFEITELTNIDSVILYGLWNAPVGGTRV